MVNLSEQSSGGAPANGSLAARRGSSSRGRSPWDVGDVGFEPNTELLETAQDLLDTVKEFEGSLPESPGGGSGRPGEEPPSGDPGGGSNPPQKAGSGGLGTLLILGAAGGAVYLATRSQTEEDND